MKTTIIINGKETLVEIKREDGKKVKGKVVEHGVTYIITPLESSVKVTGKIKLKVYE